MKTVKKTIEFITDHDSEIRVTRADVEACVVISVRTTDDNSDYTEALTLSRDSARTLAAALEEVLR